MLFFLLVFIFIHVISLSPKVRSSLIKRFGIGRFKALYSVIAGVSFTGMYVLLRQSGGEDLFPINEFFIENIFYFMPTVSILIVAAYIPNNHLRIWLRHPMLIGLSIWSLSHLMINGQIDQVLFFAGMLFFCSLMIFGILKRDGLSKITRGSLLADTLVVALGTAMHFTIYYLHEYIAGVKLI